MTYLNLIERMRDERILKQYESHVFVPTQSPVGEHSLNVYSPPKWTHADPIDITKEECKDGGGTIWQLMINLCSGCEKEARHLLAHIADMVQHPELLRRIAHTFISRQGAGKGILAWWVGRLIGPQNCANVSDAARYFSDNFNHGSCDVILRVCEKLQNGFQKKLSDRIKDEITRPDTLVRQKYMDNTTHTNYARMWAYSNHDGSIHLENSDRRNCVHKAVDGDYVDNSKFFKSIRDNICNDKYIRGVYSYLMVYTYTEKEVKTVFKNEFRQKIKELSEPNTIKFLKWFVTHKEDDDYIEGIPCDLRVGSSGSMVYGKYQEMDDEHYASYLLTLFERNTNNNIKRLSLPAVYRRLESYGFKRKRYRDRRDRLKGYYYKIDISVLRQSIAKDIGVKSW